jgi:hypothetical protein
MNVFNLTGLLWCAARICALCLLLQGSAHAGSGEVEFELFGGHDSNPSRAQAGNGVAAEDVQGASASFLRSFLRDERSGMILRGGGTILRHSVFSGLNNLALSANLRYRIQPIVGYTFPWYELSIDVERRQYANSVIRDGTSAAFELSAGKNFTDRVYSTTGVGVKRSLADRANIFDLAERKLFITFGYKFSPENTFYASLSRTRGDQVFGADETYGVRGAVKASGDDPVFGAGHYAYRMDATSTIAEAGVNLPVRGHGTWDISAKRSRAYAYGGQAYEYNLMLISWRYRFF